MKNLSMNSGRRLQSIGQAARCFFQTIVDFIYPPCCLLCKAHLEHSNDLVCRLCWESFAQLSQPCVAAKLLLPAPVWFDTSVAMFHYSENMQHLIHFFKYRGFKRLGMQFGQRLGRLYRDILRNDPVDGLIPVPLHRVRLRERGYNQSEILARAIAAETGVSVWPDVLLRRRYTQPQVKMSHDERVKNVMDAFAVKLPQRIRNAHVMLVDDVLTTGSTMNECARTLRIAGAQRIDCVTIVRV